MVPSDVPSVMPSDMPSMAPSNTPSLVHSDVPSFEPSASPSTTAPSSSETGLNPDVTAEEDAPEQSRRANISTVAIVTGALAFATVMGAGIYYYLKKTRELEEPDV